MKPHKPNRPLNNLYTPSKVQGKKPAKQDFSFWEKQAEQHRQKNQQLLKPKPKAKEKKIYTKTNGKDSRYYTGSSNSNSLINEFIDKVAKQSGTFSSYMRQYN